MIPRQAVILCGGRGSRLKSFTNNTPKPMIEIMGTPYLDFLLHELCQLPIDEILLLSGYRSERIQTRYQNKIVNGVNLVVLKEEEPRGTLGALLEHYDHLDPNFILCNADTIWQYDLFKLYTNIGDADKQFSYIFTAIKEEGDRYGNISTHDDFVTSFEEKNISNETDRTNAGLYILNRNDIQEVQFSTSNKLDLETHLFQNLARNKKLKFIDRVIERFHDFGTPSSIKELERLVIKKFSKKIILLDRDNTINVDDGYTASPTPLLLCENFLECIPILKDSNRHLLVVSNQGGISLGKFSEEQSISYFREIKRKLAKKGLFFIDYLYCTHHPNIEICECRKPSTKLIAEWSMKNFIDWEGIILIGDSRLDSELAGNLGAYFVQAVRGETYKYQLLELLHAAD